MYQICHYNQLSGFGETSAKLNEKHVSGDKTTYPTEFSKTFSK